MTGLFQTWLGNDESSSSSDPGLRAVSQAGGGSTGVYAARKLEVEPTVFMLAFSLFIEETSSFIPNMSVIE